MYNNCEARKEKRKADAFRQLYNIEYIIQKLEVYFHLMYCEVQHAHHNVTVPAGMT